MSLQKLEWQVVEKVWGQRNIPAVFGDASQRDEPVGEIWFQDGQSRELMVKRLFTSEKLSIQVHPSDELARIQGHPRGKDEAWFVLSADEGATIGAGFDREMTAAELRAAAEDGTVAELMTWHPVKPGDFFYVPAGTVHAIGAGLSVLEIQQNVDLTYRLYDYGRPRELQLNEGIAASLPQPFAAQPVQRGEDGRDVLVAGPKFTIERLHGSSRQLVPASGDNPYWLMPLSAGCTADGAAMAEGSVWLTDSRVEVELGPDACLLMACTGARSE